MERSLATISGTERSEYYVSTQTDGRAIWLQRRELIEKKALFNPDKVSIRLLFGKLGAYYRQHFVLLADSRDVVKDLARTAMGVYTRHSSSSIYYFFGQHDILCAYMCGRLI